MRVLAAIIALLVLAALPAKAFAEGLVKSVTVMPFVMLEGDGEAWLGKALADLVAQKLSASPAFDVLERDKLQAFLKEMELQKSGFADAEAIKRLGSLAQVDAVIYGNYAQDGDHLKLHLLEMDMKTQAIVQQAEADGKADDLVAAANDLVMDFLKKQGTSLSEEEARRIQFRATDSKSSLQHFYKGMDNYDNGKYEDAYGEFLAAAKQDGRYFDARLWSGKMLEYLGMTDQAVLTYTKLHADAPEAVEGRDALFFAAKLSEAAKPEKAVEYYKELAALMPKIPHSIEADMRLSFLYEKLGKPALAYKALQDLNDFREQVDKLKQSFGAGQARENRRQAFNSVKDFIRLLNQNSNDLSEENENLLGGLADITMRQSRFFRWDDALGLYRGAAMRMVSLYRAAVTEDTELKAPRGTFYVDPAHPVIGETRFGDAKSLFFNDTKQYGEWQERFYAAVVPKGYTAEGVTLRVTGYVPSPSATTDFTLRVFGFPLGKNFYNNWIGTVYGQTARVTTLQKEIAFHGRDRDILVFQLIENASKIKDWQVEFKLRKADTAKAQPKTAATGSFYEGQEVARLHLNEEQAGTSDPQYVEQYASKKRLALVDLGPRGAWMVVSRGDLGTGKTDLWTARAKANAPWSPVFPLPVNSISQDFAPKLVRAEDGSARLFWISNRRGLGWEIWTSGLSKDDTWSEPLRVPLDKFMTSASAARANAVTDLLDFDAIQDKQGRWILAVCPPGGRGIRVIASADLDKWEQFPVVEENRRFFDPSFMQDGTATYWLGAIDGDARFRLMKSFDLKSWSSHDYELGSYSRHWSSGGNGNYGSVAQVAAFPVSMFDVPGKGMTLLFSDTVTGLQYATFNPEIETPSPDLVRDISLEPYAAARFGQDYIAAAWQGDDIVLRKYRGFAFPLNAANLASDPLYHETEEDAAGNRWDRRIARTRYVMPDVTAVGAAPDGRSWWGIETGVMGLKGKDFFVSDVSMGFFYHQVTDIVPCGDRVWFAARALDRPELGVMLSSHLENATEKFTLSEASGHVTAVACGGDTLYVGTSGGDVTAIKGSEVLQTLHLPASFATAIAARGDIIWAGTQAGSLFSITGKEVKVEEFQKEGGAVAVTGLAIGDKGDVWMGTDGGGLRHRVDGKWQQFTPVGKQFPYASPGKIKSDKDGVWFMPGPYEAAQGIGYFDGTKAALFDPPSHNIFDPIDFDVAADGSVWLGSESSGIYRLERKR
ncbi:MAG: CsgG/HfaB family protein [Alphaproteobacteria bacterium]